MPKPRLLQRRALNGQSAAVAAVNSAQRTVREETPPRDAFIAGLMVGCQIAELDTRVCEALLVAWRAMPNTDAGNAAMLLEARYIADAARLGQ